MDRSPPLRSGETVLADGFTAIAACVRLTGGRASRRPGLIREGERQGGPGQDFEEPTRIELLLQARSERAPLGKVYPLE